MSDKQHTELHSLVTHNNIKQNMPLYYKDSLLGWLSSSQLFVFQIESPGLESQ